MQHAAPRLNESLQKFGAARGRSPAVSLKFGYDLLLLRAIVGKQKLVHLTCGHGFIGIDVQRCVKNGRQRSGVAADFGAGRADFAPIRGERLGLGLMGIQPSARRATRFKAASAAAAINTGGPPGRAGSGCKRASFNSNNRPWNENGSPDHSPFMIRSPSSRRRPRWWKSIPQAAYSAMTGGLVRTDPDSEEQPSSRQQIQIADSVRERNRMPQRREVDGRAEFHRVWCGRRWQREWSGLQSAGARRCCRRSRRSQTPCARPRRQARSCAGCRHGRPARA